MTRPKHGVEASSISYSASHHTRGFEAKLDLHPVVTLYRTKKHHRYTLNNRPGESQTRSKRRSEE
jgi:hypothetical protein